MVVMKYSFIVLIIAAFAAISYSTPYIPPSQITTHYGETLYQVPQIDAVYNHMFEFAQISGFEQILQCEIIGINFGGEREEEPGGMYYVIETDNTLEAILVWSRYYELTGDDQYNDEIADAWIYAYNFPAWLEGAGYYSSHNCAWGLAAELKYRTVFNDSAHWEYAENCADYILQTELSFTNSLNVMVTGWCCGNLYLYGEAVENEQYMRTAVSRAGQIMEWVEANPTVRLALESWAMSSGTFIWGLCNSIFRYDPQLGQEWLATYGPMVQVYEPSAAGWSNAWNVAYCNAQGGIYDVTGDDTYFNNHLWLTNLLLHKDMDNDGGIPASANGSQDADASWTSSYLAMMGCDRYLGSDIDAGVLIVNSPRNRTAITLGEEIPVTAVVGNWGNEWLFDVMVMMEGAFQDTIYVDIAPYENERVDFGLWTPTSAGIDSIRATVIAEGDTNQYNDSDVSVFAVRSPIDMGGGSAHSVPKVARVNIESPDEVEILRSMGAMILHDELEGCVDIVIDEKYIELLEEAGFEVSNILPLSATGLLDIDPEYHTYEEFTEELQNLASAYPGLCRLDSIGRAQQFPRTIWCMKISDNAEIEEDEIAVLYIGIHHACEVMGGETMLYMMGYMLENYGIDPEITSWIDNYEIFFVPLMNPDGHYAVIEGISEFWRKNARDTNNNGIYYQFQGGTWWTDVTEGIDLNRNYDWFWEMGGSGSPRSYYYRGDSPFSESETQAIRDLALEQHFVCGISFHSYGEVIIYPWNYSGQPAPDQDVYDTFAEELASRFIRDSGGGYYTSIYDAMSGQCRNWFYGAQGGLFFCVELMPYPIFIPPGSQLAERTERYYGGAKYLLERVGGSGITGCVKDAMTMEPVYARVEITDRISDQVAARFNEPEYGRFTRLLNPGTYTIVAGARNYEIARVENVVVVDTLTLVEILLTPTTIAGSSGDALAPESYEISLNCSPNPFNSSVTITFNLNYQMPVKVSIYNPLGREVVKLFDAEAGAGEHHVEWDADNLPSGIYFAVLSAEGVMKTQKVLLLK